MSQAKDAKSAPDMRMQAAASFTPFLRLLSLHHTAAQYVLTVGNMSKCHKNVHCCMLWSQTASPVIIEIIINNTLTR